MPELQLQLKLQLLWWQHFERYQCWWLESPLTMKVRFRGTWLDPWKGVEEYGGRWLVGGPPNKQYLTPDQAGETCSRIGPASGIGKVGWVNDRPWHPVGIDHPWDEVKYFFPEIHLPLGCIHQRQIPLTGQRDLVHLYLPCNCAIADWWLQVWDWAVESWYLY